MCVYRTYPFIRLYLIRDCFTCEYFTLITHAADDVFRFKSFICKKEDQSWPDYTMMHHWLHDGTFKTRKNVSIHKFVEFKGICFCLLLAKVSSWFVAFWLSCVQMLYSMQTYNVSMRTTLSKKDKLKIQSTNQGQSYFLELFWLQRFSYLCNFSVCVGFNLWQMTPVRLTIGFAMDTIVQPIPFKYSPRATREDYKAITLAIVCYCYLLLLLLPLLRLLFLVEPKQSMSDMSCASDTNAKMSCISLIWVHQDVLVRWTASVIEGVKICPLGLFFVWLPEGVFSVKSSFNVLDF